MDETPGVVGTSTTGNGFRRSKIVTGKAARKICAGKVSGLSKSCAR
jgi:hypothetical protein